MDIMFLLLGVSLLVALIFLVVFIVSVRSGQYDDLYTPSVRILFENDVPAEDNSTDLKESNSKTTKNN